MTTIGPYHLTRELGLGMFSPVWLAEHTGCHVPVAIKSYPKSALSSEDSVTRFTHQLNLSRQVDHPFVVKLFEVIEDDDSYYLVAEYVANGSITAQIKAKGPIPEPYARRYFAQVLVALDHLQSMKRIAHRDIHPDHVLLDRYNNVKMTDLGVSSVFRLDAIAVSFACPEVISGGKFSAAGDIWAAAVFLLAMVTGEVPPDVSDAREIARETSRHGRDSYPSFLSPLLINLLIAMFHRDPADRISIAAIKNHPWFTSTDCQVFFGIRLADESVWHNEQIDHEVKEALAALGYDVGQAISSVDGSELFTAYQLLTRTILTEKYSEFLARLNLAVGRESSVIAGQKTPLSDHRAARKLGIPVRVPGLHAIRPPPNSEPPVPHSLTVPASRPASMITGRIPTRPTRPPIRASLLRGAGHTPS
jgi:serine/threonine protein kinase